MTHTVEQLFDIARSYYPRDTAETGIERGKSPEEQRQREAHVQACTKYSDWLAMLQRLQTRFPNNHVDHRSIFRQGPNTSVYDLSYTGTFEVPVRSTEERYRYIGFMASIVVPYFVIYDLARRASGDDYWKISFTFAEDELAFAREIGRELELTFPGYSLMGEQIGNLIVPGVRAGIKPPSEATIYDCLFSDER